MRCETCQGNGHLPRPNSNMDGGEFFDYPPCPECMGYKTVSCCDGVNREWDQAGAGSNFSR